MAKELDSQLIINEEIYNINAKIAEEAKKVLGTNVEGPVASANNANSANNAKIAEEAKKVLGTNVEGPVASANTTNAITQFNWKFNSEGTQCELTTLGTEDTAASLDLFKKTKGIIFVWGGHPEHIHKDPEGPEGSKFFFKPFLEDLDIKPNALIFYYCVLPSVPAESPGYYEPNMPEFYLYSPHVSISGDKVLSFSEYRIPHHSAWSEKALEAVHADDADRSTCATYAQGPFGGPTYHLQNTIDALNNKIYIIAEALFGVGSEWADKIAYTGNSAMLFDLFDDLEPKLSAVGPLLDIEAPEA